MLKRKIENEIVNWIKNSDKALLIDGARQVGKSTTILKVLDQEKCDYVAVNLLENKDLAEFLASKNNLSKDDFLEAITINTPKTLNKGQTIIFIDEVQACRELITLVKFLVEDGSYRYILSGSVLGVELSRVQSVPVGYLEKLKMYPMDFDEFINAMGIKTSTKEALRQAFDNREPVLSIIHKKMMDLFIKYLIIGGMPDAVQHFVDNHDYSEVHKIHKNIIELYKDDFTKYQNDDKKLKLISAYNLIAAEINSQNKRYTFKDLNKSFRFERYEATFEWLYSSEVAIPVFNVQDLVSPLLANQNSRLFKLFLNDVGLLTSTFGVGTIKRILAADKNVNYGAIYENFVAQELHAHEFSGFYYKNKKFGEVDFVIEADGDILPIEVKSGKSYSRHSALDNVMSSKNYGIKEAYVFTNENLSYASNATIEWKKKYFEIRDEYNVVYLPIYMTMFIENANSL